ncbi:Centrosomal protein of 131 kDa [Chytridiales sp. JEL 0842]|nr:Centrosomal protein of 131 kDa [Chytridiales sp. JEL 0842]
MISPAILPSIVKEREFHDSAYADDGLTLGILAGTDPKFSRTTNSTTSSSLDQDSGQPQQQHQKPFLTQPTRKLFNDEDCYKSITSTIQRPSSASSSFTATTSATNEDGTTRRIDRILDMLMSVQDAPAVIARPAITESSAFSGISSAADNISKISVSSSQDFSNSAAVFEGVKAKIYGQQLEIEDKNKTINILREELNKLKESRKEDAQAHKKELKTKLTSQKKELEGIIKRHLSFIDKLIAEKDEMAKKCESLTDDVKTMDKAFKEKARIQEEQHARELARQKDIWHAAEKLKRDKWISEKTKAIKDQTVKGLEPEIQRMLTHHKMQLRQVEDRAKEELKQVKYAMQDEMQRQLDTLRDRLTAERQKACEEEKEYARQRYQKQLERDEIEFQQQKRKLVAEHEELRRNLVEESRQQRLEDQRERQKEVDSLKKKLENEKHEHAKALEDLKKCHVAEKEALKEKWGYEREEWQSQFIARQEVEMKKKYETLKEQLIKERDAELEEVIARLESETNSNASDIHRQYRINIERIKADAAEEIKQLQDQHELALDKVVAMQESLRQSQEFQRDLQKKL